MKRLTSRLGLGALAVSLAVVPTIRTALSAPDQDLTGEWSLSGANATGKYTGKGVLSKSGDTYVIDMKLDYANGAKGTAKFTGKLAGDRLTGKRLKTTGLAGILGGLTGKAQDAYYVISPGGLKLEGSYTKQPWRETLTRSAAPVTGQATITVDADRDGKLSAADRSAAAQGKTALLTLVPGAPQSIVAPVSVNVAQGKVKVQVSPAGAAKVFEGTTPVTELAAGAHDLTVQPVSEGAVEIKLVSGTTVADKASITIEKEKCYLVVFGYMGAEVNYLEGDITKAKSYVLPKLKQAGYVVIEDGSGFDQKVIDQQLKDPRSSKKVIVDWCTTTEDWNKYFDRQSIRGYVWSSHGFMEPYPGCPDSELKTFEARQWTCTPGSPESTGDKHFVREWKSKFDANAYKSMDFALNHACCTDALGSYAPECWEYCTPATKDRALAKFGSLPPAEQLTLRGHNTLKGFFKFQQGFDGPSYFGMYDVKWSDLSKAIAP